MTSRTPLPAVVSLLIALVGLLGCSGTSDITKPRLEASLEPTFSNLYLQQAKILGVPGVTVASIAAKANCKRGGPRVADKGPGADWICMIHFIDNTGAPQDGKFDLQVKANSCYIAGGPSRLIGSNTITDTHGNDVLNPVHEFDACFDPHG